MLKSTTRATALLSNVRQHVVASSYTRPRKALSSLAPFASDAASVDSSLTTKSIGDDYTDRIRQQKYDDLVNSVNRERPNPSRAWGYYVDLLDFLALEKLPLELHQLVLRKCVPPASELRLATTRRMKTGEAFFRPHFYESRLRAVISNIHAAGWKPSIDDYNFILSQFAAVGHHIGAGRVLREVRRMGVEPRTKTYGLCLQAIAHRLTLPCPVKRKEQVLEECVQLTMRVLEGIRDTGTPITSVNLDLAMRIIKEIGRPDAFEALLRTGYGIDLSFPDHHPLNIARGVKSEDVGALEKGPVVNRQPLTTAMLTTIVDFYGRLGQLSRMVQLFEVLSNPLSRPKDQPGSPAVDEDDEDDFPVIDTSTRAHPLPSADPNITTLNTMIRHCAKAGHDVLARHYLLLAIHMDWVQSNELRENIRSRSLSDLKPPKVRVNRDTMLPIVGLANRNKDRELIKWLMSLNRRLMRRKQRDLEFAKGIIAEQGGIDSSEDEQDVADLVDVDAGVLGSAEQGHEVDTASENIAFFTPSPLPQPLAPNLEIHPLDLDVDSHETPTFMDTSTNMPRKWFDLHLHVKLLRRDNDETSYLNLVIGRSLARICDRRKEMLGRRVWGEKDIYLEKVPEDLVRENGGKSEKTRLKISRNRWKSIVNFGGGIERNHRDQTIHRTFEQTSRESQ